MTREPCLPASSSEPAALLGALPSRRLRSSARSTGLVSFLSCSSSFCPRRDSLATSSSAVQLPRFGIHFLLRLVNSLRPASRLPGGPRRAPPHSLRSGLCLTVEGHLPAGLSAHIPIPASLQPGHAHLPLPVLSLVTCCHHFDLGSFHASVQGVGGVRPGRCFPLDTFGFCCPLPSLFSL